MVKQQVQPSLPPPNLYMIFVPHIQKVPTHRKYKLFHVFKNAGMKAMLIVLFGKPKEINKHLVFQKKVRSGIGCL